MQGDSKYPNQMSPNGPWWCWPCAGGRCRATNTLPLLTFPFVCFELLSLILLRSHNIAVIVTPEAKNESKLSLFGPKTRMP